MKRRLRLASLSLGAMCVGALIQSNSAVLAAESAGQGGARYQAAKREGVVNIWGTNAEDFAWIPAAFNAIYPGIKVEIDTDLNVASKVILEDRAGRHETDVVWNSEALVAPLIERNLLVDDEWEALGVRREDIGARGHMAITSSMAFAVAYRTDGAAPVEGPKRWKDLLDSRFRGKMAAGPLLFARLCAALGAFDKPDEWTKYAEEFHRTTSTLWTNDLLEETIKTGERQYVVGMPYYLAERWKAQGLPIEVTIPEPVFITQFGSVVMRKAPHPNAARLLAAWLSSPAGRAAREHALLAVDLRPSSSHPQAKKLRDSGKILYIDNDAAMERRNNLIPTMDRIISGVK